MRFSTAWAATAVQNVTLKWATASLAVALIIVTIGYLKLSLQDPLIIERACFSKSLQSKRVTEPSREEIEAFLFEVLPQRFNSDEQAISSLIASAEIGFKFKEVAQLKEKGMNQKILVNNVSVSETGITIDADRLISVGKIKSVLPFPLTAKVEKTGRSNINPYGLILTDVSPVKSKDGE